MPDNCGRKFPVLRREARSLATDSGAQPTEAKELQRLQTMIKDDPGLINGQSGNNVPLIDAASGNHLAVAKFLLDNGADVNIRRQS